MPRARQRERAEIERDADFAPEFGSVRASKPNRRPGLDALVLREAGATSV